jgi:hypothetical protein
MRRIVSVLTLFVILCGCGIHHDELERGMALRAKLLEADGCSFDAVITADFGDKTYTFSVNWVMDAQGNGTFKVTEPETIAGITGTVSQEGGKLTFDDTALAFELLADGQVTPVTAGWLLVKTLRSGYVKSCGMDGERTLLSIDDSYQGDSLHVDIWLGEEDIPVYAEILYKDRRILSLDVSNFQLL